MSRGFRSRSRGHRDQQREPRDRSRGLNTPLSYRSMSAVPAALAGEVSLRRDVTLQFKAAVISNIEAKGPNPKTVTLQDRKEIARTAGFDWKVCVKWYAVKQDIFQQIAKTKLGKHGPRPFGSNEKLTGKSKPQCRLRGEVANDTYQFEVLSQLKNFLDMERSRGHTVTLIMMKDQYLKYLSRYAAKYRLMSQTEECQKQKACLLSNSQLCLERHDEMQCWDSKADKYWDKVVFHKVGAGMRAQQRKTQLTAEEEWLRCYLTWQSMDRAVWISAYGADEELMNHVANPTQWRKGLERMPLVFWDHVPVWLKVTGSAKVVWSHGDAANAAVRKTASRKVKKLCTQYAANIRDKADDGEEQELPDKEEVNPQELSDELRAVIQDATSKMGKHSPPVQTRGTYESGGDKFRVTLILFQTIENWFSEVEVPKGYAALRSDTNSADQLEGILIVYGSTHAKLEDMDDSGNWLRSYEYSVAGRTISREKGKNSRGVLSGWRKLRQSLGHDAFRRLRIWSQPAAWADEVIHCWLSDLIRSEYQPQCVFQVDCCSGQWTERVMHTLWMNQQLQTPIAPDVTPLLQLTDTCQAFCAKRAAEKQKGRLELEMREQCRRDNRKYTAHFGQYEMFRVAQTMVSEGIRQQQSSDVVLRQAIKSQLVCWRPNTEIGGLQSIE